MSDALSLSFYEFELLSSLAYGKTIQPDAARALEARGLVAQGALTQSGIDALEPYRVRRAIVMAAGTGSRMAPVTSHVPKPLVRVNGVRIIDTVLDALMAAGINDITVVRGYLGAQFDELLTDYPNLRFIDNGAYNEANNISSIVCANGLFDGAYVCEADLFLRKSELVTPYQYRSNYLGAPVAHTDDWCFETDGNLKITELLVGGEWVHHMYGISYWAPGDGSRLSDCAAKAFNEPGGHKLYWDEVALRRFKGAFDVYVRECNLEDVAEIDTFDELVALDSLYANWSNTEQ